LFLNGGGFEWIKKLYRKESPMKHWKTVFTFFIMISLLITLSIFDASAQEKVFKLGIMAPLTGPAGKSGQEIKNGATMAFEKAGFKVGDYKIELIYIDDQSDAAKGANAASEAIERLGAQTVILDWNTAVSVATMDLWSKYKVPYLFGMGAGKAINDKWVTIPKDKQYMIVKGWCIPQKQVTGYVDALENTIQKGLWKPPKKLAAMWGEDTDWGRSLVQGMRDGLKAKGWEIFTEEYFALTQTDFYPYLSKCKQAGVTVLAGSSTGTASISAIIKQSSEIGIKAFRIADGLGWVGDWYKLVGPASDGVLDMIPLIATPAQKAWAKEFETKYGYPPSPSAAGHSYDYGNFFIRIAKRAIDKYKKLDSESVYKIGMEEVLMGTLSYATSDGALFHKRYRTTPQDAPDPVFGPNDFFFPVTQYKGGKGVVVFPDDVKEANLMVP
jgi:branched-chain amino acid transport system substrate-binding protein